MLVSGKNCYFRFNNLKLVIRLKLKTDINYQISTYEKVEETCSGIAVTSSNRDCFKRLEFILQNHEKNDCFRHHGLRGNVTKCEALKYLIQSKVRTLMQFSGLTN